MNCALDALVPGSQTVEHMIALDPEGLTALVRHLSQLGAQARWVSKFMPVIEVEADPRTCTRYPWAHLDDRPAAGPSEGVRGAARRAGGPQCAARQIPPPRVIDRASTTSAWSSSKMAAWCAASAPSPRWPRRWPGRVWRMSLATCGRRSGPGHLSSAGHLRSSSQGTCAGSVPTRWRPPDPSAHQLWNGRWWPR